MNKTYNIAIKTFQGLEQVLSAEVKELKGENISVGKRIVHCTGNLEFVYKANLYLRTALKILVDIENFRASSETEFYRSALRIEWQKYLNIRQTFAIESVVFSKHFKHSKYISLKLKDAIADYFRNRYGSRPSVNTEKPDIKIHLHINEDHCTIALDSSGEPLFKRGYRKHADKAPINEVLAAGMILLSDWDQKSVFIDPMCGSGTLLIEAALIANNIPPGIYRKWFGFFSWKNYDKKLFSDLKNSVKIDFDNKIKIVGRDISEEAITKARLNIRNAGMGRIIDIEVSDIKGFNPPAAEKGIVITNPPYDQRMKLPEIESFYKSLSDIFKNRYQGYSIWYLSSNTDAIKSFGLKSSKKIILYNGSLECKYLNYRIYKGSLKSRNKS